MIYDIAIVISLERRKDRSNRVFKHLKERGIQNVYALPAFDGSKITPGIVKITPPNRPYFSFKDELSRLPTNYLNRFQIGCTLSHISALKFAKMLKVNSVLIVEDDVEFVDNIFEVLTNLEKETSNLDWEHIYLGGAIRNITQQKSVKISEHLIKPGFTDGLQAYLVKGDGFDKISNGMLSFKTTNDDALNDIMFREKNPLKAYMRIPKVAFQITDFSELDRRIIDRQDLRRNE